MITVEETGREKERLPRGWGRFGKAIDRLIEVSAPDESLLSTCVGLNPRFRHTHVTLTGGLLELTKSTNVVLAVTDRRIVLVATGAGGAPRSDQTIPFEGLEIVDTSKKDLTLRMPEVRCTSAGSPSRCSPTSSRPFPDAWRNRRRKVCGNGLKRLA